MRHLDVTYVIRAGGYELSDEWQAALTQVRDAIEAIAGRFIINPEPLGNGVVPIKSAFLTRLENYGWSTAERVNPDRFDAVSFLDDGRFIGLEWETGNISSSHRAMNRFVRAWLGESLAGGILVLPTRRLARFLTDRVGNFEELSRFFAVWEAHVWDRGAIAVIPVEHDGESVDVPRIAKGTDGRALL